MNLRKKLLFLTAAFSLAAASISAGCVVNFATCVTDSKYGKQEQENLENLRQQMVTMMQDTEKELKEIQNKFEDPEYLDGLSPKAEEELKIKYQTLSEDLSRYQNQYYQVMNQANYQVIQKINDNIAKAAEKIAKERKLDFVMNKEACFYHNPKMEITDLVIDEMDQAYDLDVKQRRLSDNADNLQSDKEEVVLEGSKEAAR